MKWLSLGRILIVTSVLGLWINGTGCQPRWDHDGAFFMGTYVEVISPNPLAKKIVFSEFERFEKIFNYYDSSSELGRLNAQGQIHASADLFEIIKQARAFYETTQGAFDVTAGPLIDVWKQAIQSGKWPTREEVEKAKELTGFDTVYLDESSSLIRIMKSGAKIDLGGIADGYAIDQILLKLKEARIQSVLINSGGDIFGLGDHKGRPWVVGIQDPRHTQRVIKKIEVKNRAVITSGDYEQFFEMNGKRYSHIIDPKTGYPADAGITSATVIANTALAADALSTALVILGHEKGRDVLKSYPDTHAILINPAGRIYEL